MKRPSRGRTAANARKPRAPFLGVVVDGVVQHRPTATAGLPPPPPLGELEQGLFRFLRSESPDAVDVHACHRPHAHPPLGWTDRLIPAVDALVRVDAFMYGKMWVEEQRAAVLALNPLPEGVRSEDVVLIAGEADLELRRLVAAGRVRVVKSRPGPNGRRRSHEVDPSVFAPVGDTTLPGGPALTITVHDPLVHQPGGSPRLTAAEVAQLPTYWIVATDLAELLVPGRARRWHDVVREEKVRLGRGTRPQAVLASLLENDRARRRAAGKRIAIDIRPVGSPLPVWSEPLAIKTVLNTLAPGKR